MMYKYMSIGILISMFLSCNKTTENTSAKQHNIRHLDTNYIKTKVAHFTIDSNYTIIGDGKQVIEDFIKTSQFIVYGEAHNSKQTSIITKALIPLLTKSHFNYFALEVGPHSAHKLSELSTPANTTVKALKVFNTKYKLPEAGAAAKPIPFFSGISDAEFLQEARTYNMTLWGLDQEYYYAVFFLLDELLKTASEQPNFQELVSLKTNAHNAVKQHFKKEFENPDYETYSHILNDAQVIAFFNAFDSSNTTAQSIIDDLTTSWDIYVRWRENSHEDRISYMRNNFMRCYADASNIEALPKVFVKIGSLHASKILSNGAYDIGHLTEQLAQNNITMSTSINTWKPYEIENDTLINNLKRYNIGYKRYQLFTAFAKKDQWTIINLKAIREAVNANQIQLPVDGDYHALKKLLDGYDYQILLPTDQPITLNRS